LSIYLIIPAFNEAPVIRQVLESLLPLGHSLILVDDGSSDDTARIAASLPVIVIRHAVNLGQGAALETGMELARRLSADYVVHFDADGQHDGLEIENLLKPLIAGECDVVFGSRFMSERPPGLGLLKRMTLRAGRWINYWLTGILLTDAHNGFRAMNRNALEKIRFTQSGMAHATEILSYVKKYGLRYREVPVHIRYTDYSKKKGQGILESVNILFHLLFKKS
jgi:glycosyltransferase involved in cell wall biosynthesis